MDSKKKVTVSWSGGKDSAFALYRILQSKTYEVVHLHTVVNEATKRVGMHGIREALIDRQAAALGLPVQKIYLESAETHEAYDALMRSFYGACAVQQIDAVVFGDIFLEDLKQYRDQLLSSSGLQAEYPLWQEDTTQLIHEFVEKGFKTKVCAANAICHQQGLLGKTIDRSFIESLPEGVDPCGERGEFHTFLYDGPLFKHPVSFNPGETVRKTYNYRVTNTKGEIENQESVFWFQELLP